MIDQKLWKEFEDHLLNEGLSEKRRIKLKSIMNTIARGVGKNLEKATKEEIKEFINALNRNEFKKLSGESFSGASKSDIKKTLKQFYKYLRGEGEYFPPDVSWIKTRISKEEQPVEKPTLTKTEVMKLANSFMKTEYKLMTLILFDSGFRIQELLSVKKKDLNWESYTEEGDKCFWIACNVSKTMPRNIPIPLFTEDIKLFVNSSYYHQLNPDDLVFNVDYDNFRISLRKRSLKVFNKVLTPHCLRHSSATFYSKASNGDFRLLADRYGWTYSSKQLKTYIRKSGVYQKQAAKKVFSNNVLKLQEELDELKRQMLEQQKFMDELVEEKREHKLRADNLEEAFYQDLDEAEEKFKQIMAKAEVKARKRK